MRQSKHVVAPLAIAFKGENIIRKKYVIASPDRTREGGKI